MIVGVPLCMGELRLPRIVELGDFGPSENIEYHQRLSGSRLHWTSGRGAAIVQVIQGEIGPNNQHIDRLYAISAIGKRWRACYALKGNGSKGGQPVAEVYSLRSAKPVGTQILHRALLGRLL
jgi:hypothetical protein